MHLVESESEFARILQADRVILFIDFAWSGQARLSAALIQEWERTSHLWGLNCQVFRARPDDVTMVNAWMETHAEKLGGEGGYGSLIWLRSGMIVDYEPSVIAAGLRDISRRTQSAFAK
jgi:hypothetical protein